MRTLLVALALVLSSSAAFAAEETCVAKATGKKLAGAAKTSFLKKCESDAKAACEASAAEKKLGGAAKTSHIKKCLADAVGS